ncbi:MAG: hypothetical protein LKE81_05230 [Acetobacter sp.]|jgi:hypothetical protein|nr:hypothetical protein [Acetobacter sp.]MCH4060823.1 hypothetical protein [Acetobacter sp.]MCH4087763.1 hypothetical protein [Acetobacter sp.]MCI1293720.1 hypothetical protein [Acetobacter sp.]MCI1413069.1 hypothetical protein [Acetobacter sp.]
MEMYDRLHYQTLTIAVFGYTAEMMPEIYVKPSVKRGKTDVVEAIREAVACSTICFVPVKTLDC